MGMSTHAIGYAPPDDKWRKMKAIYDACTIAESEIPDYVKQFFGYEEPDNRGVEVEIPHAKWKDGMREGIEIELDKIPDHVKVIRFFNSW